MPSPSFYPEYIVNFTNRLPLVVRAASLEAAIEAAMKYHNTPLPFKSKPPVRLDDVLVVTAAPVPKGWDHV